MKMTNFPYEFHVAVEKPTNRLCRCRSLAMFSPPDRVAQLAEHRTFKSLRPVIPSVLPSLHGIACALSTPACGYSGRLGPTVGPIVRSRPTSTIPGVRGNRSPGARSTASTSIRKRFDLFVPKRRANHSTNPSNVPPLTTRSAIPTLLHAGTRAATTSRL